MAASVQMDVIGSDYVDRPNCTAIRACTTPTCAGVSGRGSILGRRYGEHDVNMHLPCANDATANPRVVPILWNKKFGSCDRNLLANHIFVHTDQIITEIRRNCHLLGI
jgi:hypothetical protein